MYSYTVHCSVRQMVEFILRSGSVDYRRKSMKKALKGIQIHNIIQKKHFKEALLNGFDYESEFPLKAEILYKDIKFEIEGRADAIVAVKNHIHIEEIKSTSKRLENIEAPNELHLAQAKCYGYLYCLEHKAESAFIHLCYADVSGSETKVFSQQLKLCELKDYFYKILDRLYFWAEFSFKMTEERNASCLELKFPYGEFRKGQRDFCAAVYRSLFSKKKLFAQAPTGTGKTVSTLFPAVKFLPQIKNSSGKIFYLTAKNITRTIAEDCVRAMVKNGLKIKAVVLSSKEKTCPFNGKIPCEPSSCEYACGHYDRVNNAVLDILNTIDVINLEDITNYCKKYSVCPFELGLDIALFADIIICDYNYAYDPKVKLKRFFSENKGDYIALVDEAHNLVDRAREMFSAEISEDDFAKLKAVFKKSSSRIIKEVKKIDSFFADGLSQLDDEQSALVKTAANQELFNVISDFIYDADFWLSENEGNEAYDTVLQIYFKAQDFLRIADLYDSRFVYVLEKKDYSASIKLFCIDPSYLLKNEEANFISTIFFSATLTPLNYFIEVLGGKSDDNYMAAASSFDKKNLFVAINPNIHTTYRKRHESYSLAAESIYCMVNAKKGNYFAFFPSYQYLNEVYSVFSQKYDNISVIIQRKNMTEAEKADFIASFSENNDVARVGFVVLGGAFSEGIDLTGNRLIGAAVVGVGLPMLCTEKNIISNYYNSKNNMGFEYAYRYPGMNKVLQAAGRVIRTHSDKGVVLLMDSRYADNEYKNLFPGHWDKVNYVNIKNLYDSLKDFWQR